MITDQKAGSTERLVFLGIGVAPVLALSASFFAGLGFSLLLIVISFATRSLIYITKGLIHPVQRSAYVLIFSSSLTALAQIGLELWLPGLATSLGVFVPLIAVHAFVIENHAAFQLERSFGEAQATIVSEVFPLTGLICLFSLIRELVGSGRITLIQDFFGGTQLVIPGLSDRVFSVLGYAAAGFILMGVFLAFFPRSSSKESS